MGACWQVAASMEAFICGRCRGDRRLSQALRVFSRDTAGAFHFFAHRRKVVEYRKNDQERSESMKAKKNKRERSPQMQQVSAGLQDVLGMTEWRKEHPHATWAEIEAAVDEQINQLRAQLLQDLVQPAEGEDWSEIPPEERPRCATCGKPLWARGEQTRLPPNDRRRSGQVDAHLWHLPDLWGRLFSPSMSS